MLKFVKIFTKCGKNIQSSSFLSSAINLFTLKWDWSMHFLATKFLWTKFYPLRRTVRMFQFKNLKTLYFWTFIIGAEELQDFGSKLSRINIFQNNASRMEKYKWLVWPMLFIWVRFRLGLIKPFKSLNAGLFKLSLRSRIK